MNRLKALFDREHGLAIVNTYDFALPRFRVAKLDSWHGVLSNDSANNVALETPIFSAKFAETDGYRHILAVANEEGVVGLSDTKLHNPQGPGGPLVGAHAHHNAIFDLAWAPGVMRFVTASGDHTSRLWQVENNGCRFVSDFRGHSRSVRTAVFRKSDATVFATGGRDGAILIYDVRVSAKSQANWLGADNSILSGHYPSVSNGQSPLQQQRARTRTPRLAGNTSSAGITGLGFLNDETLVSSGATDGMIKVWDLRRNYTTYKREPLPKHCLPYAGNSALKGFTNLIIDPECARLYANCMDNTIYCYNLNSFGQTPIARYRGLINNTFYIKSCLSPDGKYLLSGSSDEKAYIWNLSFPDEPLVALCGHNVEVTCVAWSSVQDQPIVTCSDDAHKKLWRIGPEYVNQADAREHYVGFSERVGSYLSKPNTYQRKKRLLQLDTTPRTLKRLVARNERTPRTTGSAQKRAFVALNDDKNANNTPQGASDGTVQHHQSKRPRIMDNPARCLFGTPNSGNGSAALTPIPEDRDFCRSPPNTSSNAANQRTPSVDSPTSNLPNFVRDGYAPHMSLMSPKRQPQEKIDWLTKLRKQKLKSLPPLDLLHKATDHNVESLALSPGIESPRLQGLRTSDSPRATRRRSSQHEHSPRTPTSSRHKKGTTLLRFFRVQRPNVSSINTIGNTATLTADPNSGIEPVQHHINIAVHSAPPSTS